MNDRSTPERLLLSAIAVLADQGAAALTVRNIAEGAGCSTTGVYTHFGGKDGLVDAIFVEGFESFDEALAAAGDDLVALGLSYRRWAASRPTHYQVMFASAVPGYVPSDRAMDRALRSFDGLVERVAAALDGGDARAEAFHLWAAMHGYVMLELVGMLPPGLGTFDELYTRGLTKALSPLQHRGRIG